MVYHSQDPMYSSQSKKLCFFPWCMVGKFLKKVLPFPVTTFRTVLPTVVRQVGNTYGTTLFTRKESGRRRELENGSFVSPHPLRPRFSTESHCCLLGGRIGDGGGVESKEEEEEEDHNWKRGGREKGGAPKFLPMRAKMELLPLRFYQTLSGPEGPTPPPSLSLKSISSLAGCLLTRLDSELMLS